MFSDEIFVYGGNDIAESLELFMELNSIQQTAGMEAAASGEEPGDVMAQAVREIFESMPTTSQCPRWCSASASKMPSGPSGSWTRCIRCLRNLLDEQQPELSAHLQRDQIAGHEFLTLRLDGSMIPWDELREDSRGSAIASSSTSGASSSARKRWPWRWALSTSSCCLSIGESTDHLEKIGEGPFLAEHAAIKRLEKHADQRVVSITYVSKALGAKPELAARKRVEDLADYRRTGAGASRSRRRAAQADSSTTFARSNCRNTCRSRATRRRSRFSPTAATKAFQYQTGKRPMMDSSKPLTILSHVGGSPLLFVASRSKDTVDDYDEAVAWLKQTAEHVEKIAESKSRAGRLGQVSEVSRPRHRAAGATGQGESRAHVSGVGRWPRRVRAGLVGEEQAVVQADARVAEAAADARARHRRQRERRRKACDKASRVYRCCPRCDRAGARDSIPTTCRSSSCRRPKSAS